ncbi:MAG: ribosome maturation factor RimP [Bacilli bacterium]|nr:ribosome maturation factor RimP [Bacilli bacterium]
MNELKTVQELLREPLANEGFEIYECTLSRDKSGLTLRITVDRVDPISLDDIIHVGDIINPILDANDPIKDPYTLDISSLGAEKPIKLERLNSYVGSYVNLHLSHPYKGANIIEGDIVSVSDEILTLEVRDKTRKKNIEIPLKDIDKARLAIKF